MELKRKQIERFEPISVREEIIELQNEMVVPDIYSDVMRIAASHASVVIKDKNISSDRISLSGKCDINMICATETNPYGEVINTSIPLSHILSVTGVNAESVAICDASVVECSALLINSRKISVKVKILLKNEAYNKRNLWLTTELGEKENCYCLCKEYCDEYVAFVTEKQLRIVENISLESENVKPFEWSVKFISEDVKLIKDKVLIRGTCQLKVLFIDNSTGELTREKYHFPFSSVIESDGIGDAEIGEVKYNCSFADVSANSTASGYTLNCDVTTNICVMVKKQISEKIVADVFNSKYELDAKWEKIGGTIVIGKETVKKELSVQFDNINNADKINDFTYTVVKRVSDKNVYVSFTFYVIYKDSEGEIYGVLCKYDTEYEMPNHFYNISIDINNPSMQCGENGSISMEGEVVFEVDYGSSVEIEQLAACDVLKDSLKTKKHGASLVLRKVGTGETVWDIAKRYNTSPDEIAQTNKIEDGMNICGKLIMIPIIK